MGLFGETKQLSTNEQWTTDMGQKMAQYLAQGGGPPGMFPGQDYEQFLAPMREMFAQQTREGLATAKESSGNLTGSGYANTMGTAAGRMATQQGATMSEIYRQMLEADAARRANMFNILMGYGKGAVQNVYQPGMLDYLMQGGAVAAGALPFMNRSSTLNINYPGQGDMPWSNLPRGVQGQLGAGIVPYAMPQGW